MFQDYLVSNFILENETLIVNLLILFLVLLKCGLLMLNIKIQILCKHFLHIMMNIINKIVLVP